MSDATETRDAYASKNNILLDTMELSDEITDTVFIAISIAGIFQKRMNRMDTVVLNCYCF